MTLAYGDAVDIGYGRGRLARDAAASLRRVDVAMRSAFGRAADINEAWRSPADADENYRKYLDYINGRGPWAPIALPGDQSVHCFGGAVDTDDTSDAQMAIWNDHGWYWTVYRNGKLIERWHLEYFPDRDNHRNDPNQEDTMNADQERKLDALAAAVQGIVNALNDSKIGIHAHVLQAAEDAAEAVAVAKNVEGIVAGVQNAIQDPSIGILATSVAARDNSAAALAAIKSGK